MTLTEPKGDPPRPIEWLTKVSLALSAASAVTWILVTPADPPDYPSLWVGLSTYLWHFLLSPVVNLGLLATAAFLGRKRRMNRIALGAMISLFLPFLGQIAGAALWASGQGPLNGAGR